MDNDIGQLIKRKRKEKRLTLEEVADYVGVGKSTASKWERGYIKNIKRDKVVPLANILGIDPLLLIFGSEKDTQFEHITPLEFQSEVTQLLNQVVDLTPQEKQIILSNINFICNKEGE